MSTESKEHLDSVIQYCEKYRARGWFSIPCIGKKPGKWTTDVKDSGKEIKSSKGYNKLRLESDDFENYFNHERLGVPGHTPINIAIIADENKELTDIDLDSEESRLLSSYYLPDTLAMFGRDTSRKSHMLYSCKRSIYKKYSYLRDPKDRKSEIVILEIRPLDGSRYTVFPPSIHEDTKEKISWEKSADGSFVFNKDPGYVDFDELTLGTTQLAVASVLSQQWSEGIRQDICLAVSGTLFKIGWDEAKVIKFITPIIDTFDDPKDKKDRLQGISHTWRKFQRGEAVTGLTKLETLLSMPQFQAVKDWLGITRTESPIQEIDGCICCRKFIKDFVVNEPISSFTMRPVKSIYIEDEGNYFDVLMKSKRGTERVVQLGPRSFISSRNFKEAVSKVRDSIEFMYVGNDTQTQQLSEYLADQEYRRVVGTKTTGFIEFDGSQVFVTEDGSMGKDCKLNDDVTYIGPEKTHCKLPLIVGKKDGLFTLKKHLFEFNHPAIVQGVLGWTVSCFYKNYFMKTKEVNGYPILYMSGESGSGKSQTAKSIIYGIWDVQENPLDFKGQTEFTLMLGSTVSNSIPIVLDEVKLNRLGIRYQNIFSRYVRAAFDDSKMKRGNKDLTATYYSIKRPTVVCSEVWPNETAIKERCLFLNLSQKESYKHTESYKNLVREDLGVLGRILLEDALNRKENEVYDLLFNTLDSLPPTFEGRPSICLLTSVFGLRILSEVLKMDISTEEITNELFQHFYSNVNDGTKMFKISEVDKTLVEFNRMCEYEGEEARFGSMVHNTHLLIDHHYSIIKNQLRLYIPGILPVFHKFAREYNYDGDILDKQTFMNQVKNEVYFIEEKVAKIGGISRRCVILDLEKLIKKGVDIGHPWIEREKKEEKKDNVREM